MRKPERYDCSEYDWREGVAWMEMHMGWVAEHWRKERSGEAYFGYYRSGCGYHR